MFYSVSIGGKDMLSEFGCYRAHVYISVPSVQTKFLSVPLRNGRIDLTEYLTGDVKYDDRKIKIELLYKGKNYNAVYSDISNYLHGKRMEIVFDDDPFYFYVGRCEVGDFAKENYGGTIEIEAQCDPYKYAVQSSSEDWLWDSFDFEEGYINEMSNIVVSGTKSVTLITDAKGYAKITTTAAMSVNYKNKTVNIPVGTTTMYDFEFTEGNNVLTFSGNGTVTIDYRGERL